MKDDFKKERRLFEQWVKKQFPNIDKSKLKLETDFSYKETVTQAMYIGFCAGLLLV